MIIELDGVKLSQPQLDAIVPVLNKWMGRPQLNKKKFNGDCRQAMNDAGCPLLSEKKP